MPLEWTRCLVMARFRVKQGQRICLSCNGETQKVNGKNSNVSQLKVISCIKAMKSRLPPPRQVEFRIKHMPGAAPIVISEMKELAAQLQELSVKGFICPNSLPWRARQLSANDKAGFGHDGAKESKHVEEEGLVTRGLLFWELIKAACILTKYGYKVLAVMVMGRFEDRSSDESRSKELASPKQTTLELAIPGQTVTGKESSNPFMAGSLPKTIHFCEDASKQGRIGDADAEVTFIDETSNDARNKNNKISNSKSRQKCYADVRHKPMEFSVGEMVMLKVSPWKGIICFGKYWKELLDDKLHFIEELVEIMDREVKQLKQSQIPIVNVRWNSRQGPEFTWECEDYFRNKYSHLFLSKRKANRRNPAPGRRSRKEGRM
uniref:Reverse transcriptase domain-containing protein n=1 Tax=Tanacetum cinerariifolium TaxID=118510 RepID=A0A699HSM5_TANCI|nr:hypothetical protein [Tanacetum cinerariifolium]